MAMEMKLERELPASAEEVWTVVGERFGDLSWTSGVTESYLDGGGEPCAGSERVCQFPPNMFARAGEIRERLLSFDRAGKTFSYQTTEPTGVMQRATNRWTVTPLGEARCRVAMHATVELRGLARLLAPLMRPMLRRMGVQTLRELEDHVAALRRAA